MALTSSGKCALLAEWTRWPLTRWRLTCTRWPGESRSAVSLTRARALSGVVALRLDCETPVALS
eukprot:5445881-Lingulodinium_polyedra.AAC.1